MFGEEVCCYEAVESTRLSMILVGISASTFPDNICKVIHVCTLINNYKYIKIYYYNSRCSTAVTHSYNEFYIF